MDTSSRLAVIVTSVNFLLMVNLYGCISLGGEGGIHSWGGGGR